MTRDRKLQNLIEQCNEAFLSANPKKDVVEPGLYATWLDPYQLHIKKACRLLSLSGQLLEENTKMGSQQYYTTVIESCFIAIERSIHAYLLYTKSVHESDFVSHTDIFEKGAKGGLYSKETGEALADLWNLNRSSIYYRRGIPTKSAAESMYNMASTLHEHILALNKDLKAECVC